MNFNVLILGSDPNAYYMARSYHELYNKKVDMISVASMWITKCSKIINFSIVPRIYEAEVFVNTLNNYAEKNKEFEKILLIGANDQYVRLIVENKDKISKIFVHNYPRLDIINTVLIKDAFYKAFGNQLDVPKTLVYSCKERPEIKDDFTYPIILKPGNGIEYHHNHFDGMSKVYKIKSFVELKSVIKKIEDSGYKENLIIQEFIPGDDTALFDVIMYAGKDKKVKLMTFAQIGLQERTNTGVGNCTVLVNGFNEHGYREDIVRKLADFMEKIGYQGFAEFDLKYDVRDGKYKVFEINPRQARSSYYLTACGYNLVKYLIDDLILNKEIPVTLIKEKMVLSFVPKYVINKYVTSKPLLKEINTLIKEGKFVRPLHYSKDMSLKRRVYLLLKDWNYISKYRKLSW